MKNKKNGIIFAAAVFLIIAYFFWGGSRKVEIHGFKMDTDISVSGQGRDIAKATREIESLLDGIDKDLNAHSGEGMLFELNRGEKVELPEDIKDMIELSEEIKEKSGGAFNIAIKPLVDVWGFDTGGRLPSDEEIKEALKIIAETEIKTESGGTFVTGGGKIDLGAVAKGYASDKSREILKKYSVKYAILDFGGNIVTYGKKPGGKDFVIGISDGEGGTYATVKTGETCIVTSGGYERYFEYKGKKYHHLLGPCTGYPAENGLVSVTIISENGTLADALSTTCFVLGTDKGIALAKSYKVQAVFLDEKNNVYTVGKPDISLKDARYALTEK